MVGYNLTGTRGVKLLIIWGDVAREKPITVVNPPMQEQADKNREGHAYWDR